MSQENIPLSKHMMDLVVTSVWGVRYSLTGRLSEGFFNIVILKWIRGTIYLDFLGICFFSENRL